MKNLFVFSVLLLSGCATFQGNNYRGSMANVEYLKQNVKGPFSVGAFTSTMKNEHVVKLGAADMVLPDNGTYPEYIRQAAIDEMTAAKALSSTGKVFEVSFETLDVKSVSGEWILKANLKIAQQTFKIDHHHYYETGLMRQTASQETINAFQDAVAGFLKEVYCELNGKPCPSKKMQREATANRDQDGKNKQYGH